MLIDCLSPHTLVVVVVKEEQTCSHFSLDTFSRRQAFRSPLRWHYGYFKCTTAAVLTAVFSHLNLPTRRLQYSTSCGCWSTWTSGSTLTTAKDQPGKGMSLTGTQNGAHFPNFVRFFDPRLIHNIDLIK